MKDEITEVYEMPIDQTFGEFRRGYEHEKLFQKVAHEFFDMINEQGLNQSKLASKLGVSRARVSSILSGEANITLDTLFNVAWALGHLTNITFPSKMLAKHWDNVAANIDIENFIRLNVVNESQQDKYFLTNIPAVNLKPVRSRKTA